MISLKVLISIVLLSSSVGCIGSLVPKDEILIANARYSELETHLEGKVQDLSSTETLMLWPLCYSYYNLKEYNKLFPCLDQLEKNIAKGDYKAKTWGDPFPTDMSAGPAVLRAQANIDFGNYDAAVENASKAYNIIQQRDRGTTSWIRIQVLNTLALAQALKGDRDNAEKSLRQLEDVSTFFTYTILKTDKLNGQAKTYMALGDFQRSLATIKEDEGQAWFRNYVKGVVLVTTGIGGDYDIFASLQLPKAFILNKSLYETGQVQRAKAGYDKLLAMPQTKDNGDIYWLILFDRGKIAEAEGNLKEAIDFYQSAIEIIERQRSTINTEASKIGFVGNKQQVYHALIAALFAAGATGQGL